MAGRNQHYIPKLLQKAFAIRPARKNIWCFERGEAAGRRPVKRTASGDYFYSEPHADEQQSLDDAISRTESDLAPLLDRTRTRSPGDTVSSPDAAAIVSHLAQRTAHVRATLGEGLKRTLQRMEETFSERSDFDALVGLDSAVPSDRFRQLVMSEVDGRPEIARLGIPKRVLERTAFLLAKENAGQMAKQGVELVSAVRGVLEPQSANLIRDSHNKALGEMIGPSDYESLLRSFNWSVEAGPKTGAILPDCVVIGLGPDGAAGGHLFIGGEMMAAIMLAISPEKLLVGRKPGFLLPSGFDYNVEAARLSHAFFLAPRNDEETARLHTMIGQTLRPALEGAIESAFSQWSKAKTGSNSPGIDTLAAKPTTGGRYELSLSGCGGERTMARVQEDVVSLVNELARVMPLERLDGITIVNDYPGLLQSVSRGPNNAPTPETVPPDVDDGVAQTVTVKTLDMAKGHIVVSRRVSDALISDDTERRLWGRHVLVRQLASVALMEIVEECLPGTLLKPADEGLDGWLYAVLAGVPESYAASWMAAAFGDSCAVADRLRELVAAAIASMTTVVSRERLAYREHADLEQLLDAALPAIRHVLLVSADLLGHCTFTGEQPLGRTSVLRDALDRAGLRAWFEVYFDDLVRFHQRAGRWESFDEILAFNIHAERLLMSVGMFAWEGPEGLRVEVPLGTDMEALLAKLRD